jgi:DNA repair exonuclease SbcCD ATPase subunit
MPYRIEKIVVEGFRGFRKKKELKFEQGLVILYGPQRSGKSSILNAPVWALIGPDASKVNMGPVQIRERVNWLAENLHTEDCKVEIHLQRDDGDTLVIERQRRRGRDKCAVRRNGGEVKETPLVALRLTLDGLVSSVFLPQEVIRAALSVEPRHRRAIFTQLAGLEDLRALEECFESASKRLKESADRIARYREDIDTTIKAQVSIQKERIKELSEKVRTLGLSDEALSPDGVQALVRQSVKALTEFCKKYQMEAPILPEVGGPDDLPRFISEVRSALSRFEAKSPETERQKELYNKRHVIEGFITDQQEIEEKRKKIDSARQTIAKAHGSDKDLKLAIEESEKALQEIEDQMDRAGKYLKMIQEALTYFESLEVADEIECPVCRVARVTVKHVREHLASEIEKAGLEPLRQRQQELEQDLKLKRDALNQLSRLTAEEKKLEADRNGLVKKVSELRGEPLGPNESLELVLKRMDADINAELKQLESLLEARGEAINTVRDELDKLGVLGDLLREKQHLATLDDIPNLPEYRAFIDVEDRADLQLGLLSELQQALKKVIKEAFDQRFAALKDKVNELYRRLVGRTDFAEISIDTDGDKWEVRTSAGKDKVAVTQVFNVGDITAVALCLFLASAMRASHDAGLILLDDPIQCLDEEHETRLAGILAELAEERQVVVSCSRTSFLKALETAGTVKRQVIRLAPWDNNSCQLESEAPED